MSFDYDLFVIGAGSGGLAASKRAASYGAKVAIAESDLVGGTCVIRGCVPKKMMVYASRFSHYYEDAIAYGWEETKPGFDWNKLTAAVQKEVHRLSDLHISFLEKAGVELIQGLGRFIDTHTVEVDDRKYTAEKILISVGGEATRPSSIPGIEHAITSREIFLLPEQPKRFAVLGGGYIGIEFAGVLNGLGSDVTQIIRRDKILRGFDEELRQSVQDGAIERGLNIYKNTNIVKLEKTDAGIELHLSGENEGVLVADEVLCAMGRLPLLDALDLENAGVERKGSAIAVNEYSQTSQPNIFAVGDCTDRVNLTPVAVAEGRAFADTEFGNNRRHISYENIASAVFGDPESCSVGLTEEQAKEKCGEDGLKVYRSKFRALYHNLTGSKERILMKLLVEKATDKVLGAHMVGKDSAEIIQCVAIAIQMGATKKDFDNTMALHPTSAEEFVTMS